MSYGASVRGRLDATVRNVLDVEVAPVRILRPVGARLVEVAVVAASAFREGALRCARHGVTLNDRGWCPRCAPHFARTKRPRRAAAA